MCLVEATELSITCMAILKVGKNCPFSECLYILRIQINLKVYHCLNIRCKQLFTAEAGREKYCLVQPQAEECGLLVD